MSTTLDVGVWFGCVAKRGSKAEEVLRQRCQEAEGLPVVVGLGACIDVTGDMNGPQRYYVLRIESSLVRGPNERDADPTAPVLIPWADRRTEWVRSLAEVVSALGLRIEDFGHIGTHLAGTWG